jgi:cytochrome P450
MLMDPKVWGDPGTFRPERFLSSEAGSLPNPLVVIFGFGRRHVLLTVRFLISLITVWDRVCPGMYLADRTGFHIAAKTVAAFDIAPLSGKDRPKPELAEYTDTSFRRVFPSQTISRRF